MAEKRQSAEILAPVGNRDMCIAAVRSGADAVYLGAKDFNARRNADNFGEIDLKEAIEYCHIRGVKVFLTLNIILSDDELMGAFNTAVTAYNYGVDAVIVTDLGLIKLLHENLPELPLHASTQMTVHTPAAIPFLKELGIKRVVLSRELGEEAIREICAEAHKGGIEVEVFVHGALCMSVSGQCLLSAMLGGRSGNRGLCAGPCRLPFSAAENGSYDLSLKDLSLLPHLKKLRAAGVDSFKIEGRMKRPEYVAAATAAVRETLYDNECGTTELLNNVFSRSGFTDGYFTGSLGADMFGTRTRDDVLASADVLPKIHALYRNERQVLPLSGSIKIKENEDIVLTLSDGTNTVSARADHAEKAVNRSITEENVWMNIAKLGSTPFYLEKLDCDIDDRLAVSLSVLNKLRRECTEQLFSLRAAVNRNAKPDIKEIKAADAAKTAPALFCRFEDTHQIPENLDNIKYISLPCDSDIENFTLPSGVQAYVDMPRWMWNEKAVYERLTSFKEKGFCGALCSNIAQINEAKKAGLRASANFSLNVYNSLCAAVLEGCGADLLVLSPELLLKNAKAVNTTAQKGIIAYGRPPLMLTANCPIKNSTNCKECGRQRSLTDRKGIEFPVRCRGGYSELLNSRPIWLADRMEELTGLDFALLYFTDETKSQVRDIIDAYLQGRKPTNEYTRGLYYRGVE